MKHAVSRPAALPVSTLLASTLSLGMAASACAGNLGGGATHTVIEGDAKEDWIVQNASILNLAPGATAGHVQLDGQSALTATGAQLSGSRRASLVRITNSNASFRSSIRNAAGWGLVLGTDLRVPAAPPSMVTLESTMVEGVDVAAWVTGHGQLTLSGSSLTGRAGPSSSPYNGVGLWIQMGTAIVQNGSTIRGDRLGAYLGSFQSEGSLHTAPPCCWMGRAWKEPVTARSSSAAFPSPIPRWASRCAMAPS